MRKSFGAVAFALIALSLCADPLRAEDAAKDKTAAACSGFAWPIERERGWFAAELARTPSGARVVKTDEAFLLALKPTKTINFVFAPERPPKPDSYSGDVVIAGVAAPGLYQITLSDKAWIDVFENDVRLKSAAFTGQKDCPGVRKSVRFDLAPGSPITIQISNSVKDS